MTLKDANLQETVTVVSLNLPEKTALRLQALGMLPQTKVQILQKKGNGTLIIDLRGTRFALGSSIAKNIEVKYA